MANVATDGLPCMPPLVMYDTGTASYMANVEVDHIIIIGSDSVSLESLNY